MYDLAERGGLTVQEADERATVHQEWAAMVNVRRGGIFFESDNCGIEDEKFVNRFEDYLMLHSDIGKDVCPSLRKGVVWDYMCSRTPFGKRYAHFQIGVPLEKNPQPDFTVDDEFALTDHIRSCHCLEGDYDQSDRARAEYEFLV